MVDLEKLRKPEECRKYHTKLNQWKHGAAQKRANASGMVMVLYVIGCVNDVHKFSLTNHKA